MQTPDTHLAFGQGNALKRLQLYSFVLHMRSNLKQNECGTVSESHLYSLPCQQLQCTLNTAKVHKATDLQMYCKGLDCLMKVIEKIGNLNLKLSPVTTPSNSCKPSQCTIPNRLRS